MSIVDDRGRIGGRVNLIDALLVAVAIVLIPAAYGAFLLFRTPPPQLLGITPNKLYQGNATRVEIAGRDLRPFMRVSFNDVQGRTFLIASTSAAFVDLPDLRAGSYDVVLYDYSREVARLPKALTIMPAAPMPKLTVELAGVFVGIQDNWISKVKPGFKFLNGDNVQAEVINVGTPTPSRVRVRAGSITLAVPAEAANELPATIRVECNVTPNTDGSLGCISYGPQQPTAVMPDSLMPLAMPDAFVMFQIHQVRLPGNTPVTDARVRFVVTPELSAHIRAGDSDNSPKAIGHPATITSVGRARPISSGEAGPDPPLGGPLQALEVALRIPVQPVRDEWSYKDQPVKLGASITFETSQYVVHGQIVGITMPAQFGGRGESR